MEPSVLLGRKYLLKPLTDLPAGELAEFIILHSYFHYNGIHFALFFLFAEDQTVPQLLHRGNSLTALSG